MKYKTPDKLPNLTPQIKLARTSLERGARFNGVIRIKL